MTFSALVFLTLSLTWLTACQAAPALTSVKPQFEVPLHEITLNGGADKWFITLNLNTEENGTTPVNLLLDTGSAPFVLFWHRWQQNRRSEYTEVDAPWGVYLPHLPFYGKAGVGPMYKYKGAVQYYSKYSYAHGVIAQHIAHPEINAGAEPTWNFSLPLTGQTIARRHFHPGLLYSYSEKFADHFRIPPAAGSRWGIFGLARDYASPLATLPNPVYWPMNSKVSHVADAFNWYSGDRNRMHFTFDLKRGTFALNSYWEHCITHNWADMSRIIPMRAPTEGTAKNWAFYGKIQVSGVITENDQPVQKSTFVQKTRTLDRLLIGIDSGLDATVVLNSYQFNSVNAIFSLFEATDLSIEIKLEAKDETAFRISGVTNQAVLHSAILGKDFGDVDAVLGMAFMKLIGGAWTFAGNGLDIQDVDGNCFDTEHPNLIWTSSIPEQLLDSSFLSFH